MSSWEGQVGMKWGESVQTDTMKSTKTNWNQKGRLEPTAVSHCLQPCWCGRPAGEACSPHYGDTHVLGLGVGGAEGGDSFVPEGLWVQLKPHANKWTSRPASKSARCNRAWHPMPTFRTLELLCVTFSPSKSHYKFHHIHIENLDPYRKENSR